MNFHYLAYQSTSADNLSPEDIDSILTSSRAYNKANGITGVLFYDETNFLQFLEGPKDAINAVFQRIQSSPLHHRLFRLASEPSDKRYFDAWDMGFCNAPKSAIQEMANSDWSKSLDKVRNQTDKPEGIALLLDYWDAFA